MSILIFILVLGVLVFVHELGHFLAAKACGIYVDRFSLGMPPRAFGVKIGETDYCVGALPLGGYVRMAGQEDTALSDEEREKLYGHVAEERKFHNKPLWQRWIVILAGPVMNFVLAIVLYGVMAAVGGYVPQSEVDNRIGLVMDDSAASRAPVYAEAGSTNEPGAPVGQGWQTGDRIVSIDGEPVRNITDVAVNAILGGGEPMRVVLERTETDGRVERLVSIAAPEKDESDKNQSHPRFGVMPFEPALVEKVLPNTPAQEVGLQPGDVIVRANGHIVDRAVFHKLVETWPESESMPIEVERDGQLLPMTVTPVTVGRVQDAFVGLVDEKASEQEKPIVLVVDKTKQPDLKAGDIVEKVNGEPASLALYRQLEQNAPDGTLQLDIKRKPRFFGLKEGAEFSVDVPVSPVRAIGVAFGTKMVFHKSPPSEVVPEAFRQAYQDFGRTLKTLVVLVSGDVSPKELGGPLMIFNVTTRAAEEGWWWLFKITAFVSVNLFVFNLLPLPVLDGGLLLMMIIEGIRKKPVSLKVQERVQQVGMIFLIGLLLYVTYNDIIRWMSSSP